MPTFAENRKAYKDYQILETFQAGMVLQGQEVKSIRQGGLQLAGSYLAFQGIELYLLGSTIPPYQPKNTSADYNPQRPRKLLLQKKELEYLLGKSKEGGLTLVPLKVYSSKAKIKLEFGLAKGKKKADKRALLKKREAQQEIERTLKRG
tara:strand:+ start:1389 stop:1835 length:447 start_codon:yes stop_codon:yes gene_type:complete